MRIDCAHYLQADQYVEKRAQRAQILISSTSLSERVLVRGASPLLYAAAKS